MKPTLLYIALFSFLIVGAQKQHKDTLNTEVINVVKPFNPSVSDAFKINRNPNLENDSIVKSKSFKYHIFSVPVASTFTPSQGAFIGIDAKKIKTVYNNFLSAGYGNYNAPFLEAFVHGNVKKDQDLGIFINYMASKNGVKNALLANDFTDAKVAVYYKQYQKQLDWQLNAGGRLQSYNWYGLSPLALPLSSSFLKLIQPKQSYNLFYAGASMLYYDSVFQGGTFEYNFFSDDYKTSENQMLLAPEFSFPISSEFLTTQISLAYLDGKFNNGYVDLNPIMYQFLTLGILPNLEINRENFSFNLGAKLYYSTASKTQQKTKFYGYPNLTASYKINDNGLTAFAGIIGNLNQNSYHKFVDNNPFVSPTLNIKRTDQQYNGFIGIKGLTNGVSYLLKASYLSEKDKALFVSNPVKVIQSTNKAYEFGNSFDVVYDDVKTIMLDAQVKVIYSKQLDFGGNLTINNYKLLTRQEAWNLPQFKADIFVNYTYNKWFFKSQIYMVGQRKGQLSNLSPFFEIASSQIIDNKLYVDINLNGGYNFSDRFTVFARFNNILDDNYQQFTNYDVQGFRALAGITYKFDF